MQGASRGLLRFLDGFIPAFYLGWSLSNIYLASQVAGITAVYSTEVEHDQLVFPYKLAACPGMGPGAAFSRSHNSIEGRTFSTHLAHAVFDLRSQVRFADARLDQWQCIPPCRAGNVSGFAHCGDLRGILEHSQ